MKHMNAYKTMSWPLVALSFYGIFRDTIHERLSLPLWSFLNIQEGLWLNLSVGLLGFFSAVFGWKCRRKLYAPRHLGVFLVIVLFIIVFYFDEDEVVYLDFLGLFPCWFFIGGAFLLGLLSHVFYDCICGLLSKKEYKDEIQNVLCFQDNPIDDVAEDKLLYSELVKRIVSLVVDNTGERSYSIGITGAWGTGKTTLLRFIKQKLKERKDTIIIDFSPRQSSSIKDIQKDFLLELGEAISLYHTGAYRTTHRYIKALGVIPERLWPLRVFGSLSSSFDYNNRRLEIERIITGIGKKVVVLVDDFDRLTREEIHEVLKLIDKNASFPGTFFITAFDKEQTNRILSNYSDEHGLNKTQFTDKFFSLEISLPIRRQNKYITVLRECLYSLVDKGSFSCTKEAIDQALPKLYSFLPKYLPTIRDIKRYLNLLSVSFPIVENDVLLGDFMLTSLVRYKFPEDYFRLSRREFVYIDDILSQHKGMKLNSVKVKDLDSLDVLRALFSGKEIQYRSVQHPSSFNHYFYDIDSGHLQHRELSKLLDVNIEIEQFKSFVSPWIQRESSKNDIVDYVLSYESGIDSFESAKAYLRLFFLTRTYCESRDLVIAGMSYLLKANMTENMKVFGFDEENSFVGFFRDALNDMFEWGLSIESLHDALHTITTVKTNEIPRLIFSYDDLLSFAKRKVKKAISLIPSGLITPSEVFRAMKACVTEYNPSGSGESVDEGAIADVKEAIRVYPDFFLSSVISHRKPINRKTVIQFYVADEDLPLPLLFKSKDDFSAFISSLPSEFNTINANCLSQFADLCVAQDSWTPFVHVNGDIDLIKNNDCEMYNKLFEGEPVDV